MGFGGEAAHKTPHRAKHSNAVMGKAETMLDYSYKLSVSVSPTIISMIIQEKCE